MQNLYRPVPDLPGLLGIKDPRQSIPTPGGDQVRIQPVTRHLDPTNISTLLGGLLGGGWQGALQQAPTTGYGGAFSPSAAMFNQYMQQAMQRYQSPGGFFGFQGYQFPQRPATPEQQPVGVPTTGRGNVYNWSNTGEGA